MPLTTKGPRQNARSHSMSANVTPASNMVPAMSTWSLPRTRARRRSASSVGEFVDPPRRPGGHVREGSQPELRRNGQSVADVALPVRNMPGETGADMGRNLSKVRTYFYIGNRIY